MRLSLVVVLLCVALNSPSECVRTAEKMYKDIAGSSCFRRFNATHQTGCSSDFRGSVGALHVARTQADMDFFRRPLASPPYAAVLLPHLFNRENMMHLKQMGPKSISVVILLNQIGHLQSFSHESQCPNQFSGYARDGTCDRSWNPPGTDLLHEDFPFPIYFVSDQDEIAKIVDCFEKFNNYDLDNQADRSLCSIQVKSLMNGAVNSEVCMRRSSDVDYIKPIVYCDPLQGRNVYATLYPREIVDELDRVADPNERFIVVSARMDTTSMFDGIGVGAMDSLVSFATLISTAHVLAKLLPPSQRAANSTNVLFVLFNGETYDYIGSQRLVYDMIRNEFPYRRQNMRPIQLSNIDLLVDIGTLDNINNPILYNLKDARVNDLQLFADLMRKYNSNSKYNLTITATPKWTNSIPPTSANTFLHENRSLPMVIINAEPKNQFLHSIYDTDLNIKYSYKNASKNFVDLMPLHEHGDFEVSDIQMGIRNLSTVLAYSLYELVTNKPLNDTADMGANPYLIDEFLYCWLFSAQCPLLYSAVAQNASLFPHYPPRYISIDRSHSIRSTSWTYDILGLLLGEPQANVTTMEDCHPLPNIWYPGYDKKGVCMRTTQNYSSALSPAFRIPNYDWSSGQYSTWTESTWTSMTARIFLRPSVTHNAFTLSVGLVVLIMSFILVYVVNDKTDVLFGPVTVDAITVPAQC